MDFPKDSPSHKHTQEVPLCACYSMSDGSSRGGRGGVKRDVNGLPSPNGVEVLDTHPMYAVNPDHPYLHVTWVQGWGGRGRRYVCPIQGCCDKMKTHEYMSKLEQHALTHLKPGNAADGSAIELLAFALGRHCPGESTRLPVL